MQFQLVKFAFRRIRAADLEALQTHMNEAAIRWGINSANISMTNNDICLEIIVMIVIVIIIWFGDTVTMSHITT